jgi:pSer/pThr/pTyr-binding forkhead associated (FHA) protein
MDAKGDSSAAVPPAAGDWVLSGFDTQGNTLRVGFSRADLDKAMAGAEKGIILGRSSSLSDKVVNDASVSRRHCKIARAEDGGLTIEDLNSAYGTKVNDEAVTAFRSRPLAAGAKVTMGAITLDLSQMP